MEQNPNSSEKDLVSLNATTPYDDLDEAKVLQNYKELEAKREFKKKKNLKANSQVDLEPTADDLKAYDSNILLNAQDGNIVELEECQLRNDIFQFFEKFFTNNCEIWKNFIPDENARSDFISKTFAPYQINGCYKSKPKIFASIENEDIKYVMFLIKSSNFLKDFTFPSPISVDSILKTYIWIFEKIKSEIAALLFQSDFLWLFPPSPLSLLTPENQLTIENALDKSIECAENEKLPLITVAHTEDQISILKKKGFSKIYPIYLPQIEIKLKLNEDVELPKLGENPLRIWYLIKDTENPIATLPKAQPMKKNEKKKDNK